MKLHRFFRPAKTRSLLNCLFKAACLSRLLALGWSQELPACDAGTHLFRVESTNEAATLATSLECANGSFIVEWFGVVIVAETITVAEGTWVSITGATADATADGDNASQLFVVSGASSELHFKDMVLTNGRADFGGAVYLLDRASVSFVGNTTFASNTASYGGAIFADFSTVVWDGEKTTFRNNSVSNYGGALMAQSNSIVSGSGETVFTHNWADSNGGGILVTADTNLSWQGNTSFLDNFAYDGGAVVAQFSSMLSWDGETVFANNIVARWGGAVHVVEESSVSWTGNTTFLNNSARYRGGAVFVADSSEVRWGGNTTFVENTARRGGAVYANSSSDVIWDGGDTAFSRNYASGYGGALMADGSSEVSWGGGTVFVDNSAYYRGGAVFLNESSTVFWTNATPSTAESGNAGSTSGVWDREETTFSNNTALVNYGGAIVAEFSSSISWDGKTVFADNYANLSGGAICVRDNSHVSWDGNTVFVNNDVPAWGGGLYVTGHSNVSWAGTTKFISNHALDGGGLLIYDNSIGTWEGTTTFENNRVMHTGGAITVHRDSGASWTGETIFTSNTADRAGAVFVWDSSVSWAGNTTFSDNVAFVDGGAVFATAGSNLHCQGTTAFRNNSAAAGNGGALGIYAFGSTEGSYANISGETTFTSNVAWLNGGAVFSSANPRGHDYEGVVFRSNSAAIGGAVATFGTGNNDEVEASSPTTFSRCRFINNAATETGGALETAFGQEKIVSCHFENNSADVGGALRLGGATTIRNSSFVSNLASTRDLAVSAVGSVEIHDSSFRGNAFLCRDGTYLRTDKEEFGTARYDSVCGGCPSWEDCQGCTVVEIASAPICSNALEHTNAKESGNTLETLSVDGGYWRATSTSDTVLACFNPEACAGGQTGAETFCKRGYSGAYCSVCESGYSPSLSSTCTRCSPSRRYWLEAFVVFVGVMVVWAMTVLSEYLVSSNFEQRRTSCIHHRVLRWVPLQAFKSVIVVWQIITQFASVANVPYPGAYQTFLSVLDFFNFDVGFVISAACLWSDSDFHDRLLLGTIWPLVILGLLATTYAIALRRNAAGDSRVRDRIRHKHLSAGLLLLFFVYSSVSSTVFRMFACDSLDDGEEYLRADYRIMCTDAKHRALQVYAGFMIVVYPMGIPLLFGVLLYRHREVLSDPRADKVAAQSISSLWAPYLPNRFYYELVECARRIMLTGMVVFIYPNDTAQIAITIIITFCFFVVSEVLSPYESVFDTWVTRCGHVLIFFSMFDVLLLRVDVSQESNESQKVLAGVLVVGHVVMIVAVVAEACALFLAAKRKRRVVEEPTPSQRALRTPSIVLRPEQTESDYTFQGRNVLVP